VALSAKRDHGAAASVHGACARGGTVMLMRASEMFWKTFDWTLTWSRVSRPATGLAPTRLTFDESEFLADTGTLPVADVAVNGASCSRKATFLDFDDDQTFPLTEELGSHSRSWTPVLRRYIAGLSRLPLLPIRKVSYIEATDLSDPPLCPAEGGEEVELSRSFLSTAEDFVFPEVYGSETGNFMR
jgi:hypothetical protein